MGKKLPKPKRHFGVRDPLKQLEEREKKLRDKTNNPPAKDENQQAMSQSMRRFMQMKSETEAKVKAKKVKKKPQKKEIIEGESQLVRQRGETEESYLKRLNMLKNSRLREALYAAKYNVKIERNETTGEMKVVKGARNEIDELILAKKLGKRAPKKKPAEAKKAALLKLKQKKKDQKTQKQTDRDELRQFEHIPFGERVDAPPTLVTPRKARGETKAKNARSGLLLTQIVEQNSKPAGERKEIDFSRVRREQERESIVKMYKEIKKRRREEDKVRGKTKGYEPGNSL